MALRRITALLLLLMPFFLLVPDRVSADTYGDCDTVGCLPDDDTHYWCWGPSYDGFAGMKNGATHAMSFMERDTLMNAIKVTTCTSSTDVKFVRGDLGSNVLAQFQCTTKGTGDVCAAGLITINRAEIIRISTTAVEWSDGVNEPGQIQRVLDHNSCHENGHSLGFDHHPAGDTYALRFDYYDGSTPTQQQDCLVRGWIEGTQNWLRYNPHHAEHLYNYFH